MGTQMFTFPFLCSSQLSQQIIIGHNFCNIFNVGTIWTAADVMSLTYEGKPIAQCIRTKGINALVFFAESIVIPPYSSAKMPCKAPKLKSHSNDMVKAEIDKLLEAGVIRESDSSWSAPVVVIPKGDGGKRLCIDFRALNAITRIFI